jgi:hypothetical protein
VEGGISFGEYSLASAENPNYPFGMYAIFHKQKLTNLSYTLAAPLVKLIERLLERQFGVPSRESKDTQGNITEAIWTRKGCILVVKPVAIKADTDDKGFLRITEEVQAQAVLVRICVPGDMHLDKYGQNLAGVTDFPDGGPLSHAPDPQASKLPKSLPCLAILPP